MNFARVGIIDFFGILCPGILLSINLVLLLFSLNAPVELIFKSISKQPGELSISILLFVLCYLFGFVLRLISPDNLDRLSSNISKLNPWLYHEKHKLINTLVPETKQKSKLSKGEKRKLIKDHCNQQIKSGLSLPRFFWREECYPYYISNKYIYCRDLPSEIASEIMADERYHNKNSYNFWKTIIASKDPNLSVQIFQAEALVRFMSGSFWALPIGVIAGAVLTCSRFNMGNNIILSLSLVMLPLIVMGIILKNFKIQRHREIKVLLDAIYIISKTSIKTNDSVLEFSKRGKS